MLPGSDEINAKPLKISLDVIVAPLTHICNLSLQDGIFPAEMKHATVVPLYKSDDPMAFNNYRPVSLLPVLPKVFEKLMYTRFLNFLNKYQLLCKYQFGFRKLYSTCMALIMFMDKLSESLDDGKFVVGVFLDFSKAFDTVDQDILTMNLAHYGIRGNALN